MHQLLRMNLAVVIHYSLWETEFLGNFQVLPLFQDPSAAGNFNIAIENHHLQWVNQLQTTIFNSDVELPEGTFW